jgi:hypothetical protein
MFRWSRRRRCQHPPECIDVIYVPDRGETIATVLCGLCGEIFSQTVLTACR